MNRNVVVRYTPSTQEWVAVVSGQRAVLLERRAAGDRLDEVLTALDTADTVDALLGLLLRDGLAAMPDFAFAEIDSTGARVLVRGSVTARLNGHEYAGSEYSTWGEHRSDGADAVVLFTTPQPAENLPLALPLGRGAAYAAALELTAVTGVEERSESPIPDSADLTTSVPVMPMPMGMPAPTPVPETAPEVAPPTEPAAIVEQTMVEFTRADAEPGYSHLFEETIVRPIEHAAVREEQNEVEVAPVAAPSSGLAADPGSVEHDGLTIVSGDLAKLRAEAPRSQTAPIPAPPENSGEGASVAELRFSSGAIEKLTGPVIVGRSPSSGKVSAGRLPRLVTITDDPDLSRSHVQIEMQGDAVVVTDLHSRNGTTVVLPGRAPERLRSGVPTTVIDKTLIDLGGGLTIEVRDVQGTTA